MHTTTCIYIYIYIHMYVCMYVHTYLFQPVRDDVCCNMTPDDQVIGAPAQPPICVPTLCGRFKLAIMDVLGLGCEIGMCVCTLGWKYVASVPLCIEVRFFSLLFVFVSLMSPSSFGLRFAFFFFFFFFSPLHQESIMNFFPFSFRLPLRETTAGS